MIYKNYYLNTIYSVLITKGYYTNLYNIPQMSKITLNITHTDTVKQKNKLLESLLLFELLTGQKAVLVKTKKAISNFNIKKNIYASVKCTLTGINMYEFLYKLLYFNNVNIGQNKIFIDDKINNNISFSLHNLGIFPEIEHNIDKFSNIKAIEITINFKNLSKKEENLNPLIF